MLRKAVQRKRRCALKTNIMGGGLQVAPGTSFESTNGVPYATNVRYDECYTQGRPGALTMEPNVDLAQTAMAGGNRQAIVHPSTRRNMRRVAGGAVADFLYNTVVPASRKGRKSRKMRGGCGCMWKGGKQRGGQCPYKAVGGQCPYKAVGGQCPYKAVGGQCQMKQAGGQCPYKAVGGQCGAPKVGGRRTLRGGNRGFSVDVAQSVGGEGPNVAALYPGLPCDARAGANNPNTLGPLPLDPRAYGVGYSATSNTSTQATQSQTGGQLSERIPNFTYSETLMGGARRSRKGSRRARRSRKDRRGSRKSRRGGGYGGNGFDPACYKAPGSEMPVYPATSAGFHFTPNIASGEALPAGVIPFNEVVQHTARLGGARKSRKAKKGKASRKVKKSRRSRH